ncbi:uncharacterized protein LOC120713072 isoform X1 [Panicum virgatum]|uniref:Uncharacterized protein n=2 Tax=Panicum virgatum TaxID=38727 RepID=A0A8T0RLQ9_PANVG|nr:uncharacterized protein LOC120713072 isoform X1 [Panicum virgatum]KAG2585518.1 hypothetical protein PVAP13_6KG393750 [Panicum virgatum]KAG2585519.1 hypothetical protein PVAP13_6KG393750 [Panicum virgatum]KAG2585520.1 hypothetical protein PVAP13_6KG393750 [Panicum virgatum]
MINISQVDNAPSMKGVWFSMCFCRITSPLSLVPMSRWMGALSTRASGTQQEGHSRLRPLCYRGVDVFILSSLVSRKSCENVLKKAQHFHLQYTMYCFSLQILACRVCHHEHSKQVELDEPYK